MKDLIFGKRVAVVGGSPKVVDTGLGEFIEDYDTIVRINIHWPSCMYLRDPIDCTEDVGRRTDVLFMNPFNGGGLEAFRNLEGVKYVIFTKRGDGRTNYPSIKDYCDSKNIPCDVYRDNYGKLKISERMFAGTLALMALMQEEPEEIFMTGFDFFVDDYREVVHGGSHDAAKDRDLLMKQVFKDPRVKMAEHVRDSLGKEMPNMTRRPRMKGKTPLGILRNQAGNQQIRNPQIKML